MTTGEKNSNGGIYNIIQNGIFQYKTFSTVQTFLYFGYCLIMGPTKYSINLRKLDREVFEILIIENGARS